LIEPFLSARDFPLRGKVNGIPDVLQGREGRVFYTERMTMRRSLLQLACIAALGGLALVAQAQQYGSPASPTPAKPTSPPVAEPKTQADNEYRAALAKCNTYTEKKRSDCVHDAEIQYNQSFSHGTAAAGGAGGTSATGSKSKN
jgi:hypothetical protein